jgi:hypothetical protein
VIFYETCSRYYGRPRLYIEDLFVVADRRGTSVGEMLVRKSQKPGSPPGASRRTSPCCPELPLEGSTSAWASTALTFQFFRRSETEMALLAQPSSE